MHAPNEIQFTKICVSRYYTCIFLSRLTDCISLTDTCNSPLACLLHYIIDVRMRHLTF